MRKGGRGNKYVASLTDAGNKVMPKCDTCLGKHMDKVMDCSVVGGVDSGSVTRWAVRHKQTDTSRQLQEKQVSIY